MLSKKARSPIPPPKKNTPLAPRLAYQSLIPFASQSFWIYCGSCNLVSGATVVGRGRHVGTCGRPSPAPCSRGGGGWRTYTADTPPARTCGSRCPSSCRGAPDTESSSASSSSCSVLRSLCLSDVSTGINRVLADA